MAGDYYKILGVEKNSSDDDIKKAYRKLAQQYHPDKASGNEQKFKEINEAYQVLSNKEKRAQYDRFGKTFTGGQGGGAGFSGFQGFDFSNINFDMGEMGDLGDIFESMFGSMGGKRRKTYTRGNDLQAIQQITLVEAFTGVKKELRFKTMIACEPCTGLGYFSKEGTKQCETCNGRGEVKEVRNSFFGNFQQVRACDKCFGTGQIPNKICNTCKGAGRTQQTKVLTVDILPGVSDTQLIKLAGMGEAGERGAPAGDLYVQVMIAPDKVFRRQGEDLFIKHEVRLTDVLLNKKLSLPSISGKQISIEIPAGFNLAEQLKVSGEGMPRFGSSSRGNLYVSFEVKTPKKISSKAKQLLTDLENELD